MIKVLIGDDHPIVREGLKQILEEIPDIVITGEASTGQEVITKIWKENYDVVLLDISMPGRNGLDILKQLKGDFPQLSVLILSMHPENQYAMRALRIGACGYLTKGSIPDELVKAIRKISSGRKYITPFLAEQLAYNLDTNAKKPLHEKLTNREYEILRMIAIGKTTKIIAMELSLSVNTINSHRAHILKKMRMKNNAEIMYYAMSNRLVSVNL